MPNVLDSARSGGRHAGLVRRYATEPASQIRKAIRSLHRRIDEHLDNINHPRDYLPPWATTADINRLVNGYWPKEVALFRQQVEILQALLKERDDGN